MAHAMKVREAVCTNDYVGFFKLYAAAPNMGRALMDMAAPAMRWGGLNTLVRALKPSAAVPFIARLLGFSVRLLPPSSATSQPEAGPSGAGEAGGFVGADSAAGTPETSEATDALVVLHGSSQAVFAGKFHPEVRPTPCSSALRMTWGHDNPARTLRAPAVVRRFWRTSLIGFRKFALEQ